MKIVYFQDDIAESAARIPFLQRFFDMETGLWRVPEIEAYMGKEWMDNHPYTQSASTNEILMEAYRRGDIDDDGRPTRSNE